MNNIDKLTSLIPLEDIEQGAIAQIEDNLQHDFMLKMAIMPDVHQGYDLPIGAVALLDDHISPSYVGYDIGCGMTTVNTFVKKDDMFPDEKSKVDVFDKIYEHVPVGVGKGHENPVEQLEYKTACGIKELDQQINAKISSQFGSLGSGNHFIEIGYDKLENICVTIHSGSRGAGWKTADWYMKQGRFLNIDTDLGKSYIVDMNYFLEHALKNRKAMMDIVLRDVLKVTHEGVWMVNENHNHAEFVEEGVLHRKGATQANEGQLGIIPCSMEHGVYVTKGTGNDKFLNSSSHGAGRLMGRGRARRELSMDEFTSRMTDVVALVEEGTIDESPMAYKDPVKVIEAQEGVVLEVIDRIKPIINIKATNERFRKKK